MIKRNKIRIIKLSKPEWLMEMIITGRLLKNFKPKNDILLIENGKTIKPKIEINNRRVYKQKIKKFERKVGNSLYIFDPKNYNIYKI